MFLTMQTLATTLLSFIRAVIGQRSPDYYARVAELCSLRERDEFHRAMPAVIYNPTGGQATFAHGILRRSTRVCETTNQRPEKREFPCDDGDFAPMSDQEYRRSLCIAAIYYLVIAALLIATMVDSWR